MVKGPEAASRTKGNFLIQLADTNSTERFNACPSHWEAAFGLHVTDGGHY